MPRYSIIIPHFNSLDSLKVLLDSIPISDDIQVIVVDDNSTVRVDELHEYMASQGRVVFFVNDTGVQSAGACRNIGLSHATGKWVLFADADDWFIKGFVDVIDRYFDSEVDVIYFTIESINLVDSHEKDRHLHNQTLINEYQKEPSNKNKLRLLYRLTSPVSKMINREYLETHNIGFEPTIVANDTMFSTKASYHLSSFKTEATPIYMATRRAGTLTSFVDAERFRVRRDVFIRRCNFLRDKLSPKDYGLLGLSGHGHLLRIQWEGLGLKLFVETFKLFRVNKIKTNWPRYFNPYSVAKRQIKIWYWKVKTGEREG